MTGGYLRFEVSYAYKGARHVFDWTDDPKAVPKILARMASNPNFADAQVLDRDRVTKLDKARDTATADRPRPGLLL
jgi:hypothetical protein